jgi:hypothetical protein
LKFKNIIKTFGIAQKKRTKIKCPKKIFMMNFFSEKSEKLHLHHNALNTKNMILWLLPTFKKIIFSTEYLGDFYASNVYKNGSKKIS